MGYKTFSNNQEAFSGFKCFDEYKIFGLLELYAPICGTVKNSFRSDSKFLNDLPQRVTESLIVIQLLK